MNPQSIATSYRPTSIKSDIFFLSQIVCLQEVQGTHYTSFYEPEMKKLGK